MAIADEVNKNTQNTGLESLRLAVQQGYSKYGMVDGVGDVFTDETGVDTGSSSGQIYNDTSDYYSNVPSSTHSLLIQSETSAGSTVFTDSSGNHTPTANGGIAHSTTEAYFGSSSIRFDGTDDFITFTDDDGVSDHWNIGANEFTIEAWVRVDDQGAYSIVSQQEATGSQRAFNFYVFSQDIYFQYSQDGSSVTNINTTTNPIPPLIWKHVAVVRDGDTFRVYVNGTQVASGSATGVTLFDSSADLAIGAVNTANTPANVYKGYMEEVSVLIGTARYTGTSFDPPDAPFSIAGENMVLLSNAQTADSAPTTARAIVLYDPVDVATLNTDFTLEVSMDGGATFSTAFTLEKNADYDANVEILESDNLTLDSTSGTSMVYRAKSLNSKDIRVHGVYLQWA